MGEPLNEESGLKWRDYGKWKSTHGFKFPTRSLVHYKEFE